MYVWGRRSWEKRKAKREKRKEKRGKKEKIKRKEERKRIENKNVHIQINTQTNRRTDRHKSFIDMRYNTEQYGKSTSIESNRIESYRINLK